MNPYPNREKSLTSFLSVGVVVKPKNPLYLPQLSKFRCRPSQLLSTTLKSNGFSLFIRILRFVDMLCVIFEYWLQKVNKEDNKRLAYSKSCNSNTMTWIRKFSNPATTWSVSDWHNRVQVCGPRCSQDITLNWRSILPEALKTESTFAGIVRDKILKL